MSDKTVRGIAGMKTVEFTYNHSLHLPGLTVRISIFTSTIMIFLPVLMAFVLMELWDIVFYAGILLQSITMT